MPNVQLGVYALILKLFLYSSICQKPFLDIYENWKVMANNIEKEEKNRETNEIFKKL